MAGPFGIFRRRPEAGPIAAREAVSLDRLDAERQRARRLRAELDHALADAESRLRAPRAPDLAVDQPPGTDWAWRPDPWSRPWTPPAATGPRIPLGPCVTLFHDAGLAELTLRQTRTTRADDRAPYALDLAAYAFDGSYVSLVLDLPREAVAGLSRRHLLRLDLDAVAEAPLEVFARLNLRHGPDTEAVVRDWPGGFAPDPGPEAGPDASRGRVEFDLAHAAFDEARLTAAWVDLIVERPRMTRVTIRDLTLLRCPRARL